jgi:hypothetical protein
MAGDKDAATYLGGSGLLLSRLSSLLLGQLDGTRGTLGLGEVTLLNAGLQGLVEQRVELSLGCGGDLVVGLDVFLDGLTASENVSMTQSKQRRGEAYLLPFRSLS